MYPIERVEPLNAEVTRMVVRAPEIARKIRPGQFIMLRIDERGERIPLTMNECDPEAGTVTIVFQAVGATTMRLAQLKAGDALLDFAGPLGNPTELEGARRACVIGGGLGTAIAYPQAKWLHEHGCEVDVITGFRNKDLILLEDEINACSARQIIMTDDGSNGNKGLVTQALQQRSRNTHSVRLHQTIRIRFIRSMRSHRAVPIRWRTSFWMNAAARLQNFSIFWKISFPAQYRRAMRWC